MVNYIYLACKKSQACAECLAAIVISDRAKLVGRNIGVPENSPISKGQRVLRCTFRKAVFLKVLRIWFGVYQGALCAKDCSPCGRPQSIIWSRESSWHSGPPLPPHLRSFASCDRCIFRSYQSEYLCPLCFEWIRVYYCCVHLPTHLVLE